MGDERGGVEVRVCERSGVEVGGERSGVEVGVK